MLDLQGYELDAEEKEIIKHPLVGGIILFTRNYHDRQQLQALIRQIRSESRQHLLLAVDQEGGRVQRFRHQFTSLPAAQSFALCNSESDALRLARDAGWLMAYELTSLGIDISFAPVLDVGHQSAAIGDRAFHDNPDEVIKFASQFIEGMHQAGMRATGKHFPGHGAVIADSHLETPVDNRTLDELNQSDLAVFRQIIKNNLLDGIMPAHVIYAQINSNPASGSHYWIKQILRQQLGFKGIVFSDDLSMEGAAIMGNYAQRAKSAMQAGCDILLICNQRQGAISVLDSLPQTIQVDLSNLFQRNQQQESYSPSRWQQVSKELAILNERWQEYKQQAKL